MLFLDIVRILMMSILIATQILPTSAYAMDWSIRGRSGYWSTTQIGIEGEFEYGALEAWTIGGFTNHQGTGLSTHFYPFWGIEIGLRASIDEYYSVRGGWKSPRFWDGFDLGLDVGFYSKKRRLSYYQSLKTPQPEHGWEAGLSLSYLVYESTADTSDKLEEMGIVTLVGIGVATVVLILLISGGGFGNEIPRRASLSPMR